MDYLIHIAALAAIYSIAVLGLNYAAGYAGLISLNYGAYMAVGAYTSAIFLKSGFPFPVAFLLAAMVTGLAALLISFPLLKLRDDSFVLVSFGFSFIVYNILLNWRSVTNGALGIKGIPLPAITDGSDSKLVYLFIILAALLFFYWFLGVILRSSYGVIVRAIRENQKVTQVAGHRTDSYRRSVFVTSALITGCAGAFLASFISTIDPVLFTFQLSVLLLIMTILGGLASRGGSLIGATIVILIPEALRFLSLLGDQGVFLFLNDHLAEIQQILYGLMLILLMFFRPKGLFGHYKL